MGSTQGVKDSSRPAPKKLATISQKLPDLNRPATLDDSFWGDDASLREDTSFRIAPSFLDEVTVCGGFNAAAG